MKKSIFLTVLVGLFLVSTVLADPGDTLWTRTYGGSASDVSYAIEETSDGGYIVAGATKSFGAGDWDFYLLKIDTDGDTLWTRAYGGSALDMGSWVRETLDGGYILAGQTSSFGAGGNDVYVVKTDANGDTLWTSTYGGSADDRAYSVQQTSDGGYIIAGDTESFGAGCSDAYLVKTDSYGDTLWTRTYGGSFDDMGYSVQETSDSGYVLAGATMSFGAGIFDFYLVKTDANGDTLWTRTYGGPGPELSERVQQTADGGYILAGSTMSFGAGAFDVYLVKTDANGDALWTSTYGGSANDYGRSARQTSDGGYIIAGDTESFGAGYLDVYLLKTDSSGDTLWTRTYGGSSEDVAYSVQQTTDGEYIATGWTMSFGAGGYDVYVLRVAGEAPQPDVSIEIVPDDPPVTVPQGGIFGYTGTVTNNTEDPQTTDIWVMAAGPLEGVYGPFKDFYDLPLNPGQSRSAHFNQRVRNLAPVGFYNYIAYCGDYPSVVVDSSYFEIEVVSGPTAGSGGWVLTGSFLEGDVADIPSDFAPSGNYPNPFNAGTVISYRIPFDAHVKVEVYNISGQKIAALVDGQQEAGYRSVTWDASKVSSGVYFYKLTAGDFSEIKTMTLLR
jgi:hypothetical protein